MTTILGRVPDAIAGFSSALLPVLEEACAQAGLTSDGAKLLRPGENAIFRLPAAPVVVRIARSAERLARVGRELCVARWLAKAGVPAVRVHEVDGQPLLMGGCPVSFWQAVTGGGPAPTHADLARLLAAFHGLGECPCDLARFEPLHTSRTRLECPDGVNADDRAFLQERCAELTDQFAHLEFSLPVGPIHGDAHTRNLLTDGGRVVLLDFEAAAIGPREWDLLPTAIAVDRYGLAEDHYRQFVTMYGFDVREWPGYPVLRAIREVTMTTWIMQNVGESAAAAAEFALRVGCLREGDTTRAWHFF